jgi:NADH dehydrogenase FAD-containing subunit
VTAIEGGRVLLTHADLPCDVAVVCAGFVATSLAREAGLAFDARGRAIVDGSLRSVSHPAVFAVGDAGDAARMSCHNGVPTGAHAADVLASELRGRAPRAFDFGSFHLPISLGRHDGLIQFTHHDDTAQSRVLTGRPAALYKEIVTASGVKGMRWERRLPGLLRWPHAADVAARDARVGAPYIASSLS